MQLILDFLPVIAFYAAYQATKDFSIALVVIIVVTALQVSLTWLIRRTVPKVLLGSAALVIGLGGISLLLKNDLIFKWKPTVLYWVFAAICAGSHFIGAKPVMQRLMESVSTEPLRLEPSVWRALNAAWVAFFILMGAANLFVAYRFPEEVWVNFKLFGLLGLTVVFVVLQAIWLGRHMGQEPAAAPRSED